MKNGLDISSFGATDTGCVRENNEDTLITMQLWDMRHTLLVAIDGMGGEEGGEVAAEIARKTIIEFLTNNREGSVLGLLKQAMTLANNEIVKAAEEDPRLHRMGCVATAGIVSLDEATLYVAHVGDSRLYRYSHGELTKLTHDHSLVGYQEEQGLLTEEQAMHHPRRSVIERCLGSGMHTADERGFIDGSLFPLVGGETFVFCSDGLCDMVTSAQIAECLRNNKTAEDKCLALIEAAKDDNGRCRRRTGCPGCKKRQRRTWRQSCQRSVAAKATDGHSCHPRRGRARTAYCRIFSGTLHGPQGRGALAHRKTGSRRMAALGQK